MKRRMRLPDMEIAALFCDEIVGRFTWVAGRENGLDRFCDALVGGCSYSSVKRDSSF